MSSNTNTSNNQSSASKPSSTAIVPYSPANAANWLALANPAGWTNFRKDTTLVTTVHFEGIENPVSLDALIQKVRLRLDHYAEARRGWATDKNTARLNLCIFPEFWHNMYSSNQGTQHDGSKTIPSSWVKPLLGHVQAKVVELLNKFGELHVVAMNLVCHLTDENGKEDLQTDMDSGGRKRRQVTNATYIITPDSKQSFSKSQFASIDNMGDVGNYPNKKLADNAEGETKGIIKLITGGYFILQHRVCVDVAKDFTEQFVNRPDAMLVLGAGVPKQTEWDLYAKPWGVIVSDTMDWGKLADQRDSSGYYRDPAMPRYSVEEAAKAPAARKLGRMGGLGMAFTGESRDEMKKKMEKAANNNKWLWDGKPKDVAHTCADKTVEKFLVVQDIKFPAQLTEQDLDNCAAIILADGSKIYTSPGPK